MTMSKISMAVLGLVFAAMATAIFVVGCDSREVKMSPIEKMFETNPDLASYAMCQRAAGTEGHQGGVNVRDCDVFKENYRSKDELAKCNEALGGVILQGREYSPEQVQAISNVRAACYLIIYKREKEFDQLVYKICRK